MRDILHSAKKARDMFLFCWYNINVFCFFYIFICKLIINLVKSFLCISHFILFSRLDSLFNNLFKSTKAQFSSKHDKIISPVTDFKFRLIIRKSYVKYFNHLNTKIKQEVLPKKTLFKMSLIFITTCM